MLAMECFFGDNRIFAIRFTWGSFLIRLNNKKQYKEELKVTTVCAMIKINKARCFKS